MKLVVHSNEGRKDVSLDRWEGNDVCGVVTSPVRSPEANGQQVGFQVLWLYSSSCVCSYSYICPVWQYCVLYMIHIIQYGNNALCIPSSMVGAMLCIQLYTHTYHPV